MIGKYQNLTKAVMSHPLEFYSSMAQLNLKLGKQQFELFSRVLGLGNKEMEALSHSTKPELLAEDQKEIYEDIQSITKESAENVIEMVYETVSIMDQLADEKSNRPRSRVTRSTKAAKSRPVKAA